MRGTAFAIAVIAMGATGLVNAGPLTIDHTPLECMASGAFATVEATVSPPEETVAVQAYFRARGTEDWFYVELTGEDGSWSGLLPSPAPTTDAVDYFVLATDQEGTSSRTEGASAAVTQDCASVGNGAADEEPSLAVGALRYGSAAAPPGFLTDGITTRILSGGRRMPMRFSGTAVDKKDDEKLGGLAITGLVAGGLAVGYGTYALLDEDTEEVVPCSDNAVTGDKTTKVSVKLYRDVGAFLFEWDMGPDADQMRLIHTGNVVHNTGCVTGSGSSLIQFGDHEASKVLIEITAGCGGAPASGWSFTAHCPE